ncbi:hypothetical protein CLOM_g11752 [Closterium sp. NIES-68]|nr:hypothetical protein CLOM_g11752 [Closterium sp. NIES-68]
MADGEERAKPKPFKAEYAKSGRASCRKCKENIGKDAFRIAKVVESKQFDGFMTLWFHSRCVFKAPGFITKSRGRRGGVDALRWEDQQALRAYAKGEGGAQGAAGGKGAKGKAAGGSKSEEGKSEGKTKAKGRKAGAGDEDLEGAAAGVHGFQVAYAASNGSACRHCTEKIPKGQLRVGRMEPSSRGVEVVAWRHAACVGEEGIWPPGASVQGVEGWDALRKEDQATLQAMLGGQAKGKGKGKEAEPPKKRQRLAEQDGGGEEGKEEGSRRNKKGKEEGGMGEKGKGGAEEGREKGKAGEAGMSKELEKALEQQARRLWEVKDKLRTHMSVADMRAMLTANQQDATGSEDALRDRCADAMLFGPLPPCPLCSSPLEYWDGQYRCRGFLSAWSACSYSTREVQRREEPWTIPDDISNPFADEYRAQQRRRLKAGDKGKSKGRGKGKGKAEGSKAGEDGEGLWPQRLLPPEEKRSEVKKGNSAGEGGKEGGNGRAAREAREAAIPDGGVAQDKPLEGLHVALLGRLSRSQAAWRKEIEEGGGSVAALSSAAVDCVVATEAEAARSQDKLVPAITLGAPLLSEAYLLDSLSQCRRLPMRAPYLLPLAPHLQQQADAAPPAAAAAAASGAGRESKGKKGKERSGEGEERVRSVRVKGRAAVHEASGLGESGHVLDCDGTVWSTTLNLSDLSTGANSYYILQIIEDDKSPACHVFRKWGRVGSDSIGGSKVEGAGREQAVALFRRLFKEKTGNDWDAWQAKTGFQKQPGKFYPLEIDYGATDDDGGQGGAVMGTRSKLDGRLVALLMMIFDLKSIREAMVEFEINVREMPLGKLTKRHIERGFQVLTDVQAALQLPEDSTGRRESAIVDASNRFFTLIPTVNPAAIRTLQALSTKIRMLEALRDMEVTSTLLSASRGAGGGADEDEDPVDGHYRQLQCGLKPLERSDADYSLVSEYLQRTHAPTHKEWDLQLLDVFRVDRSGERQAFRADLKNHMLLWHGSRVTNFVGILSQGLRIAPPEAPVTGYMFGKGVYFADLVSKSAQYCFTSADSSVGLLLLSRVALGALHELTQAEYIEKLPRGKHATKGLGMMKPKEDEFVKWASDVVVPCGKPVPSGVKNSQLRYNEFIVYDTSQIQLEFLLKVKFIHKR